ncbi:MAG: SPOR domain-containing protein [Bacteroidales bacterium]|nr:SPOR domain-containing protein [Bacteroidales bacterium]
MTKFKLMGLSLMALAMVALVDCKGNKSGAEASETDTLSNSFEDQYNSPISEQEPAATAETADSNDATADESVYTETQNGEISRVPEEQVTSTGNYYIVAGSFKLYSNAQSLNQKLKAKGFDSKILEPYAQYNRVTVKQFNTVEEARAALPGLRSQIDQTLWILSR